MQAGEAGAVGEDVGRALAVGWPGGMVGRDIGDLVGEQALPHQFDLGLGAEGRVAFAAAAEADDVVLGHAEILDAGFAGGLGAHRAEGLGDVEAAGEGGVGDVDMGAGLQADFEDFEVGHGFGERRAGAAVPDGRGVAGGLGFGRQALDEFLVLVVDGDGQTGFGDFLEGGDHGGVVDAREADGVVFVGREFEGGDAGGGEIGDGFDAAGFLDGAVERDIDMRGAFDPADLFVQHISRGDGLRHVIGHVDTGGDAAGRGAAGGALDAGPADGGGGVHVAIDQARHDVAAAVVDDIARGRGGAGADGGDGFAADGDIAAPDDFGRCHDIAHEDAIEWISHGIPRPAKTAALAETAARP